MNAPDDRLTLPFNHAFVVQFQPETPRDGTARVGRVEHLDTGRSRRFRSWQELEEFMVQQCGLVSRE
jgi:hypothetical protein